MKQIRSRTSLIARPYRIGRARSRASLLAVNQAFTALIFWFFCIKAKEQKIEKTSAET